MLSKKDITRDWLPRYTGTEIGEFGDYILLTNFDNYVTKFPNVLKCRSVEKAARCRPVPTVMD